MDSLLNYIQAFCVTVRYTATAKTVFGNIAAEIADLILRILKQIQGPCHFFA